VQVIVNYNYRYLNDQLISHQLQLAFTITHCWRIWQAYTFRRRAQKKTLECRPVGRICQWLGACALGA